MTFNIKTLQKSKIIFLLIFLLLISIVSPGVAFADNAVAPILTPNITATTSGSVIVTIVFPSKVGNKEYKIAGGNWHDYNGPVSIEHNTTMEARYNNSEKGTLIINNIVTAAPTLTPDITTPTSGSVTVAVGFPSGANSKKYSLDGGDWHNYNRPIIIDHNTTMEAKYILYGNDSEIGSLTINNINGGTVVNSPGNAPTLTPNITTSTTGKIIVTITFPSSVDTFSSKQFSLDNGVSWMDYTGPVSITDNITMKAMYTYLNGSDTYSSQIGSLTIDNITGRTGGSSNNGYWDANNGYWAIKTGIQKNYTPEADVMSRIGDIDNFGLNFQTGYDPFSGNSTPVHSYPWSTPSDEPTGLDRIMEINGYYLTNSHSGTDGYTTAEGTTRVQAITMNYDLTGINVTSAKLQMFVDDFQAGIKADNASSSYYRAQDVAYKATINGVEVTELSSYINQLNQSGPIGKLITFNLPANYLQLVRTGQLVIKIDDPNTARYGDGYAIDFIKILINPKDNTNTSSISGRVTDVDTNVALSGAKVTACGLTTTTDSNGNYSLPKLTPGLAVIQANNTGYTPGSLTKDLVQNITYTAVDFKLKKTQKPGIPVISEDILVPTSSSVNMTVLYPDNPAQKQYSDHQVNGEDVWVNYTGSFVEAQNCTIKAKSISAASDGSLTSDIAIYNITNIDTSIPSAPTLSPSTTAPTNGAVIVTAVYPTDATVKQISVDGGATWTSYTEPVTIEFNTIVVAKCANSLGTRSPETRLPITNINKSIPDTPVLTQDITELTNRDVIVTATYPSQAVTREISLNGGTTWSIYTQPVVITHNTTVEARCSNSVGTQSIPAILEITNIDKSVPPTPVLVEDNTQPTNASVNVTASYDQVAVKKEISVDNGVTWKLYSGSEVIVENTIVKARCTNAVETQSLIAVLEITNIDKSVPAAPKISSSNVQPTNQNIVVTVAYPANAQDKQISLDNGATWKIYAKDETIIVNTTVLAKYKNVLGTQSDTGILNIANIDKSIPDAPTIISSNTNPTNEDITVTIEFPTTSSNKQVSLDNGVSWKTYTSAEVEESISANTIVLAKYENYVGTPSIQGSLNITNIDKSVPTAPTVIPSTTGVVVLPNSLTVSVIYPAGASNKSISIDNGTTWTQYTVAVEINNNTTVYATYKNNYGTTSDRGSCILTMFDTRPAAPTFTPSTEGIVVKPDTLNLTVNYLGNAIKKYISIDNQATWKEYTQPEEISTNMTVYAKCETALGTSSAVSHYTSNFDSKPDRPTFRQDVTTPTTGVVNVTVIPSQPGLRTQWSMNGSDWNDYTATIQVNVNHTIIYARCISLLGTPSETAQHEVTNIDTVTNPSERLNR